MRALRRALRARPKLPIALLVLALLAPLLGGIAYAVWRTNEVWWLGLAAALPLVVLVVCVVPPPREGAHFGADGPWGPP